MSAFIHSSVNVLISKNRCS